MLVLDGGASLADRESSLDLIKLDISRTFPALFIFQKVRDDIYLLRRSVWKRLLHFHFNFVWLFVTVPVILLYLYYESLHVSLQGGPYHDLLHSVLGAYTCYRPDIGYVSFLFLLPSKW